MSFRAWHYAVLFLPAIILVGCNLSNPKAANTEVAPVIPTQADVTLPAFTPSPSETNPPEDQISPDNSLSAIQFNSWEIVHDLAFSPNGSMLAVSAGDNIHIYDAETLEEKVNVPIGVWASRLTFHPSLPLIALAKKDGTIEFRDRETGDLICQFTAHVKGANSLSINPDGRILATTGTDIKSRLWDISPLLANECTIREMGNFIGESYSSPDVEFSPDGKSIALVDLDNIRLRNTTDRKLIALLEGSQPIFDIEFSPDGRWLASAGNHGLVTVWDLAATPKPLPADWIIPGQNAKGFIWRVAFSSDSHSLAAGSSDGKIYLIDLFSSEVEMEYSLPRSVTALAFSPDGRFIAAGGLDAQVSFFSLAGP